MAFLYILICSSSLFNGTFFRLLHFLFDVMIHNNFFISLSSSLLILAWALLSIEFYPKWLLSSNPYLPSWTNSEVFCIIDSLWIIYLSILHEFILFVNFSFFLLTIIFYEVVDAKLDCFEKCICYVCFGLFWYIVELTVSSYLVKIFYPTMSSKSAHYEHFPTILFHESCYIGAYIQYYLLCFLYCLTCGINFFRILNCFY